MCILVAEAIKDVFEMNEVFDVIEDKAAAVHALEDVVETLAGQAEASHVGEREGLGHKEQELVGQVEDGGHVGGRGLRCERWRGAGDGMEEDKL